MEKKTKLTHEDGVNFFTAIITLICNFVKTLNMDKTEKMCDFIERLRMQ